MEKRMKWLLQDNLYNEDGYVRLIESLKRLECDFQIVKVVPFTNILLDEHSIKKDVDESDCIDIKSENGKIICMGATSMTRIAKNNKWIPGTYLDDNFNYQIHIEKYGNWNMLNDDIIVDKILNLPNYIENDIFIRPIHDTKAITGTVFSPYNYKKWINKVRHLKVQDGLYTALSNQTVMMMSSVKNILSEYRIFIVDGKIITGSKYKQGNQVIYDENYDITVNTFVMKMLNIWQPHNAFVMDIALTSSYEYKIIEINCINSAGFYNADIQKVVMAIEEMERIKVNK